MKTIYEAIQSELEKVPALRWVDLEAGQLEMEQPPVAFPCALIDLQISNAENNNAKQQNCDLIVRVVVGVPVLGETSAAAPAPVRAKALEFFDISTQVYKALQGFETAEFSPLSRKSQTSRSARGLKKVTIEFKTNFTDYSAEPEQKDMWG